MIGVIVLTITLVACMENGDKTKYVYFVTNGGEPVETIKFNDTFDSADLDELEPIKENHDFISWHTDGRLSDELIVSGTLDETTTLYAKWLEVTQSLIITITFDTLGGNVIESITSNEPFNANELNHIKPEKQGFTFVSWHTDSSLSDLSIASGKYNESTKFYAKWEDDVDNLERLSNFKSINDYQKDEFQYSGLPSVGNLDVLVIPVEINGQSFPSDYLSQLEIAFNGTSEQTGWESVSTYYDKSSFGNLNLNFDIVPKYTTSKNRQYYENYNDSGDQKAILEVVEGVDSRIDFSNYDFNNDGLIDSVIFIYSVDMTIYSADPWWAWVYTPEEELSDNQPYLDGMELGYYMWASFHFMFEELNADVITNTETYIHEMGHLFGLADYYSESHEYGKLGGFDMMDFNIGDHGPLNKLLLGWESPFVVNKGTYNVNLDSYASYDPGGDRVLIIPKSYSTFDNTYGYSEYLVVMYYQPSGLYDAHMEFEMTPGEQGLVIYHVNATLKRSANFWEMFQYENYYLNDKPFIQILEANKANSLPGNSYLTSNAFLKSGGLNLSSFKWHDGSSINIELTVGNLGDNNANFNILVN